MTDASNLSRLVEKIEPHEIYNLAAQSNVAVSFEQPQYTVDVNAVGTLRLLDTIRNSDIDTRFYQASTSELYGGQTGELLDETSPFCPQSPYATSKLFAYWITVNYREAYNIHASNGILFNHESPRRGKRFVTRKITRAAAKIKNSLQDVLYLGNLDAKRDWGYAPEYVEGMWQLLQQDQPGDYVLATGEAYSVRTFVEKSFAAVGFDIEWVGEGVDERGIDTETGDVLIKVHPKYFRPNEVETLIGNAEQAKRDFGWEATTGIDELVEIMVESDHQTLNEDGEIALDYLT
jgi:GDPmannose 4,6-dehydratase